MIRRAAILYWRTVGDLQKRMSRVVFHLSNFFHRCFFYLHDFVNSGTSETPECAALPILWLNAMATKFIGFPIWLGSDLGTEHLKSHMLCESLQQLRVVVCANWWLPHNSDSCFYSIVVVDFHPRKSMLMNSRKGRNQPTLFRFRTAPAFIVLTWWPTCCKYLLLRMNE